MTTPHTPQRRRRPALRRLAPAVVTVGVLAGAVVAAAHGPQAQHASLRFTASGSTAPVGNGTSSGNTDPATGCNANGNCVKSFGVKVADVSDLWPGYSPGLRVTYTNPYNFLVTVTQATVSATSTSKACEGMVTTDTYTTNVEVRPGVPQSVVLPFGLSSAAPNACKGAAWSIRVTAQAVK